jgi:hypothetical protein
VADCGAGFFAYRYDQFVKDGGIMTFYGRNCGLK